MAFDTTTMYGQNASTTAAAPQESMKPAGNGHGAVK
jgi:hypothetical protein